MRGVALLLLCLVLVLAQPDIFDSYTQQEDVLVLNAIANKYPAFREIGWTNDSNANPCYQGDPGTPEGLLSWRGVSCALLNSSIYNLTVVNSINLDYAGLTGPIPYEFANLTYLSSISLAYNNLTGEIPKELEGGYAYALDFSFNNLTGPIPDWDASSFHGNLEWFHAGDNELTGNIPISLRELNISSLNLANNLLMGNLNQGLFAEPSKWNDTLKVLRLTGNAFTGPIPATFTRMKHLRDVYLSYNMFDDVLPDNLGDMTNLQVLDLSFNQFTGSIPDSINELSLLTLFNLRENQFSGAIPLDFGEFQWLIEFVVSCNAFEGPFPESITEATLLRRLHIEVNQITSVPEFFNDMPDLSVYDLESMNFSCNLLPEYPTWCDPDETPDVMMGFSCIQSGDCSACGDPFYGTGFFNDDEDDEFVDDLINNNPFEDNDVVIAPDSSGAQRISTEWIYNSIWECMTTMMYMP